MVVEVPFEGYSKRIKTVEIGGKKLLIKPKVADSEAFMLVGRNPTEESVKRITSILTNMIKRAYVEQNVPVNDEDLSDFIAEHYGELYTQCAVYFGFATKEELEVYKKKAVEEVSP